MYFLANHFFKESETNCSSIKHIFNMTNWSFFLRDINCAIAQFFGGYRINIFKHFYRQITYVGQFSQQTTKASFCYYPVNVKIWLECEDYNKKYQIYLTILWIETAFSPSCSFKIEIGGKSQITHKFIIVLKRYEVLDFKLV